MSVFGTLRKWARRIKTDVLALWFARQDARTPWYAKALGLAVVAYALSPIDLIPDFIPVLGYLDDVVILPLLIWWAVRCIPPPVMEAARQRAAQWLAQARSLPRMVAGAVAVVVIWVVAIAAVVVLGVRWWA